MHDRRLQRLEVRRMPRCSFLPPYLVARLAETRPGLIAAVDQVALDERLRSHRATASAAAATLSTPPGARAVHDAEGHTDLPGTLARREGEPATGDAAVDEGYDGAGAVRSTFRLLGHESWDGAGAAVVVTVHYGRDYVNAFWDGTQLVFGDGDGELFARFTRPLDVVAHEFTHGVVQSTAALRYEGQSGALNESVCDVFAAVTEQRVRDQDVTQADWLIGSDLLLPGVQGIALRSMREPGTAYDDDRLGKDPQVGTMADYVQTSEDHGGVHLNSGIPNRAFVLAATALGGRSWETAAPIWWRALTGSRIGPDADFATFADATVAAAGRLHGVDSAQQQAVRAAWQAVGVEGTPEPTPAELSPSVVRVSRSGGFTGLVQRIELDPATDSRAVEVADLLASVDLTAVPAGPPQPDRFVYTIDVGDEHLTFGENDLPPRLGALVRDVLDR